jgi:hypothetical protein
LFSKSLDEKFKLLLFQVEIQLHQRSKNMKRKEKIKATKFEVGLPFGLGKLEFETDEVQQKAAWELYVELTTRISVQPLGENEGIVREALSSLYKLFDITRGILRRAGPVVAQGPNSLGPVAIDVLNKGIKPFLAKWHPILQDYENLRPANLSQKEHEDKWESISEVRKELSDLRNELSVYTDALAQIAGI